MDKRISWTLVHFGGREVSFTGTAPRPTAPDRYPDGVQFPDASGRGRPGGAPGMIDYRLDRRRTLRAFRSGELDRQEICDAQIELMRVGRDYSKAATTPCPVCEERTLRHVRFVFGPRLPPAGRCVTSAKELERLAQKAADYRCYLVEVCIGCRWNHLLSSYLLTSKKTA